jgi:RNA polymerase sigma-70 factor, ECF subfamily
MQVEQVIRFEELYQRYAKDIFRFTLYLSGDRALAEDLTSETFVRAWTSPSRLRSATVKAYLLAISRNLYLAEQQRNKRHQELDECVEDASNLARQTEARLVLSKTLRNLQQLPEGDRAALLMRVLDEMSYQEIAAALGINLNAAKARIFRARLRLAQIQETLEWKHCE